MVKKTKSKPKKEKIKEKVELSQEEINSLEQRVEKEVININKLQELLNEQDFERSSPSLEKINAPQRNHIILERDIITGNTSITNNKETEENGFKYIPSNQNNGEPQYIPYGEIISENFLTKEKMGKWDREQSFERKSVMFESSAETRNLAQDNFEKYGPVKKVEMNKLGKEKPFEKKEVKYTPGKY